MEHYSQMLMIIAAIMAFISVLYVTSTMYVWKSTYRPWLSMTCTILSTMLMLAASALAMAGCTCSSQVEGESDAVANVTPDAPNPLRMRGTSTDVVWECLIDLNQPCPWGPSLHNQAIAWPFVVGPANNRLGYIANPSPYLLWMKAHVRVTITSGSASVYAGMPDQMEKFPAIAALSAGQSYVVIPLADGVVLSVESSGDPFTFEVEPL